MSALTSPKHDPHPVVFGAVVFAVLLLSRAPQLLGPHLALDGDEAIVGLMAQDLLAGEIFPTFFYGQSYGVATFEVLCIAVMFVIVGPGVLGIKLGSLMVFGIGVLALASAARTWGGHRAGWLVAAVCVAMPAWWSVSLRGWGINLSAWVCVNVSLWLVARLDTEAFKGKPQRDAMGLGIFVGLIVLTQPLAIVGVAPFFGWILMRQETSAGLGALAGLLFVTAGAWLLSFGQDPFWSPAVFDNPDPFAALAQLPERIWTANGGVYHLGEPLPLGPWITLSNALWLMFYTGVLLHSFRIAGSSEGPSARFVTWASLAAIALTTGVTLFINPEYFGFRYLLWPTPYLALLAALSMDRALALPGSTRRVALAAGLVLAVSSSVSLISMRQVTPAGYEPGPQVPQTVALESLVEKLRDLGVRHVYSTDAMFQWVLMFASEKRIQARWITASDRLPGIPPSVDRALRSGERVAVVGPADHGDLIQRVSGKRAQDERRVEIVGSQYVLWVDPTEKDLRRLGFEIPTPGAPATPRLP